MRPPVTSTLPDGSSVTRCWKRGFAGAPFVAPNVLLCGSYSSASVAPDPLASEPPTTSTLPDGSSAAAWRERGCNIAPGAPGPDWISVLVAGSYSADCIFVPL